MQELGAACCGSTAIELLGINRRLHDPARRRGGKWLLALVVLAGIAAVGVAFAYCMGIAYALSAIGALPVFPVMLVSVCGGGGARDHHRRKAPDALFGARDLDTVLSAAHPGAHGGHGARFEDLTA